jgi:quinol monooxygenase YgiN
MVTSSLSEHAFPQDPHTPYVRIAELEVDPVQLESFKLATEAVVEASVRVEPGRLAFYAVAEKADPSRVRVFEMYRDADAYQAHLRPSTSRGFWPRPPTWSSREGSST